jgi:glycosyltransferase involved in cell wall biosynthesis
MKKPMVTIGIPVYNGEEVIEDRVKQILTQTFQNFILIISDNGSTDQTQNICEKLIKNDERITYFRHKENNGPIWNSNFLLNKAVTDYFVWAAVDDIWSKEFLEKNITILENNDNIVGCISEYDLFNRIKDPTSQKIKISVLENIKKFQFVHPVKGTFEEKIKFLLNFCMGSQIYSVFRTKKLQKVNVLGYYKGWMVDLALVLNIIKEGDLEVTEDAIMHKHVAKKSTSIIKYMINQKYDLKKIIFLENTFTFWCLRNLGIKNFFKNFNFFIRLNVKGYYAILAESIRICKRMSMGQEKYW